MAKSKKHEEKGNREDPLRDSVRKKLARSPGPLGDMQKQTPKEIASQEKLLLGSGIEMMFSAAPWPDRGMKR